MKKVGLAKFRTAITIGGLYIRVRNCTAVGGKMASQTHTHKRSFVKEMNHRVGGKSERGARFLTTGVWKSVKKP